MRSLAWKMAEPRFGCLIVPIIISGQCKWSVGWSVANVLSHIIPDQHWTVPDTSKHQNGPIQTTFLSTKTIPDTSDRSSKNPIFWLFWNRSSDFDPTEAQLATSTFDLFCNFGWILYESACLKPNLGSLTWKMAEPHCRHRIVPTIISGQGKMVCWLVGGKCVKGSCPRSTVINDIQSQSHPNINLGQ